MMNTYIFPNQLTISRKTEGSSRSAAPVPGVSTKTNGSPEEPTVYGYAPTCVVPDFSPLPMTISSRFVSCRINYSTHE